MFTNLKAPLLDMSIKILTLNYFVIKNVIKKWAPKRVSVLDLGCGLGELSTFFSKQKYLGIDLDPVSITLAKKRYPQYRFQVGDITKFRTKKKFELILVIGVLHHLDNKNFNRSIKTIDECLKNRGRVIIIEAIPPIWKYNIVGKFLRENDQGHFVREYDDYKKALKKKFTIIHSRPYHGGIVDYGVFIINK